MNAESLTPENQYDAQDSVARPAVGEVIALPELLAGEPEVIATERALAAGVRWAHVVAGTSASALLDGGELILTTGEGWPTGGVALRRAVQSLIDAGITALVFELGPNFPTLPTEIREVCAAHDIALIALHREVRFVHITQRIHRRILSAQNEALQAREQVHRMFNELGLNRSPVDYMVEQMAATLHAPVVLENSSGEVVAYSVHDASVEIATMLQRWVAPRQNLPITQGEPLERVSVEAQGTRWGTLTALPGPAHPAGRRTVLELGAITLALARLADDDGDEWLRLSSKRLINALLEGRYRNDASLTVQLTAGGLPVADRVLMGATLTGVGDFGSHTSLERAVLETALRRAVAPEAQAIITDAHHASIAADMRSNGVSLIALLSFPPGDPRIASGTSFAVRLARELDMLVPTNAPASWRAHVSLGAESAGVRGLLASIDEVLRAGVLEVATTVGRVNVQQAARQPLAYLMRSLIDTPEVQDFIRQVLGPIIEHDRDHAPGDLMSVLAAVIAHPTNRSLAAGQARLSRSVFYQRIDLIEDLLDIDLTDGDTIATLAVALTAHRI